MPQPYDDPSIAEITALLGDYFDGLYDGDVDTFDRIFHPHSHLYETDGQTASDTPKTEYLDRIRNRESGRAQGLKRHDRIISIHKAGPNTALATVNCALPPRYFTDYLTLVRTGEGWQIISKTYHVDVHE